ncbi:ribose-5-phosphate isomerase [Janibacter sp. G56]|uniref:ribose-5-phosphate isomerase n=1 Tax=Janibacter sp. G56 TaxID=3418717 RepID=UPI003CFEA671
MARSYRVLIGSDKAGMDHKDAIYADLREDDRVSEVTDLGVGAADADERSYPSVAIEAATRIAKGEADRAILVCGTGIGVAIAATKVKGIRATVAHDSYSVERSVLSNDCQIVTFGQRVIGRELARRLAREWLSYEFDPSSHSQANVGAIDDYEASC